MGGTNVDWTTRTENRSHFSLVAPRHGPHTHTPTIQHINDIPNPQVLPYRL
jgi:hypothetical protein